MQHQDVDTETRREELKQQLCRFVDALVDRDPEQCESDFVFLLTRVQELVERKRRMEGSKTDTRDLVTELLFSRLRSGMQAVLQKDEPMAPVKAAEWVMGMLFSVRTMTELAQAVDQVVLASSHSSQDFNFASRTDFVSLEEVLQMLGAGKHTGCLSLEKADNRLDIYLQNGRIAFLDSHHMIRRVIPAADSLRQREIPLEAVTAAEARHTSEGQPVLLALHEAGHFKDAELRDALRLFGREVLFDFMIESDPFVFFFRRQEELPAFALQHDLRLGITSVLLEGSKRLDDWQQMRRVFPDAAAPIEPREDMYARMADAALDVIEIKLLSHINGDISPRGMVPVLGLPLHEVYQRLVRLAQEGIIASPAGEAVVDSLQLSVEESLAEAFAALDANDDATARSHALDQVLGDAFGFGETRTPGVRGQGEIVGGQRGEQRRSALDRVFDGDAYQGEERRLDQGFLKMLGKSPSGAKVDEDQDV